ncbi:MAG: glycosyltransferase family 2 protein [Acidobacteria bacterium]|nr:glycosyltransferase family 2 protein [Acidobacteriota bacterium]
MSARIPKISVCVPAYNRAELLPQLLDSIVSQDYDDFDIVISEDASRDQMAIREIVKRYERESGRTFRYFENERNFGYDRNLRTLIERADGEYCLFVGNDDILCPGAVREVANVLARHENVGVLLRSWAAFTGDPSNITTVSRYFPNERFFPAGADTVATFYRRCVVLPGLVLHREGARKFATDRYDGTTLYQVYIVARMLMEKNGAYVPAVLALRRDDVPPEFGLSESERAHFVPGTQTPESSLFFARELLRIAEDVDREQGVPIYRRIVRDVANYSYPFLAIQVGLPFRPFLRYALALGKLGLNRSPMFHLYYLLLLLLGRKRATAFLERVRSSVGRTPLLGRVYPGERGRGRGLSTPPPSK